MLCPKTVEAPQVLGAAGGVVGGAVAGAGAATGAAAGPVACGPVACGLLALCLPLLPPIEMTKGAGGGAVSVVTKGSTHCPTSCTSCRGVRWQWRHAFF